MTAQAFLKIIGESARPFNERFVDTGVASPTIQLPFPQFADLVTRRPRQRSPLRPFDHLCE